MKDNIRTLADLGTAIRALRREQRITTVDVAAASGRSRDVLHRLEHGQDVSAASLLAIVAALGYRIDLRPARRPTLDEMARRFEDDGA